MRLGWQLALQQEQQELLEVQQQPGRLRQILF
jgi:hypothetical protein